MDSVKNEGPAAIIVDDNVVATTNGINGNHHLNHEETATTGGGSENMKTRSKTVDSESAVATKTRTARAVKNDEKTVDTKGGKTADTKSTAGGGGTPAKEATIGSKASQSGGGGPVASKKTKNDDAVPPAGGGGAKKKAADRDDDSGVNSRASSVSNEDIGTPRIRTRSSKSAITSTPSSSYKRGQERLPLSAYDFDDIMEEDEATLISLKRKAVVYVEEMDDDDSQQPKEPSEPLAKRAFRTIGHVGSTLLTAPFRAIRGKLSFQRGGGGSAAVAEKQNSADSVDEEKSEKAEDGDVAKEKPIASTATDDQRNSCALM